MQGLPNTITHQTCLGMGFFLFVSSLAVLLFGVVLLISSPSERALNTALLAWKSKGKLVEVLISFVSFVVFPFIDVLFLRDLRDMACLWWTCTVRKKEAKRS